MNGQDSLKDLERRAYRSTFQDGLWDLFIGLILTGAAIIPVLSQLGIQRPLNIVLSILPGALLFLIGKRKITIPRMGVVRFAQKRQEKRKRMRLISLAFVLVFITIITSIKMGVFVNIKLPSTIWIGIGFIVLPLWFVANLLDFYRLSLYGVVFVLCWALADILNERLASPLDGLLTFGVAGSLIVLYGTTLLVQFMITLPKPESEVHDG